MSEVSRWTEGEVFPITIDDQKVDQATKRARAAETRRAELFQRASDKVLELAASNDLPNPSRLAAVVRYIVARDAELEPSTVAMAAYDLSDNNKIVVDDRGLVQWPNQPSES